MAISFVAAWIVTVCMLLLYVLSFYCVSEFLDVKYVSLLYMIYCSMYFVRNDE